MNAVPDHLRLVDAVGAPLVERFQRPGAIEAEQALLGAALLNAAAMAKARDMLVEDDFGEEVHRAIWRVMCEAEEHGAATLGLVKARLGSAGDADLGGISVSQYLARMMTDATTIVNTPHYCEAIRDNADRRRLSDAVQSLPTMLNGDADVAALAGDLMSVCDEVGSRRTKSTVKRMNLNTAFAKAIEGASEAYRKGGRTTGITWGCRELDEATGGLRKGDLILQMGRPSMGKTALSLSVALASAKEGWPVLFFSMEMQGERLASRLISALCYDPRYPIPYFNIDRGRITPDEFGRVTEAARASQKLPILIEPQSHLSASQIASRVRRWTNELTRDGILPGLVIVDYIGLMAPSSRYAGRRVDEVTEMSAGLKSIAKEFDVPVLALSQMSRQSENRDDKRPQLSDLRDSGSLEQDADVVLGLFRPAYHLTRKASLTLEEEAELENTKHILEAIILKQRNGPTGRHELFCDIGSNFISDLAR